MKKTIFLLLLALLFPLSFSLQAHEPEGEIKQSFIDVSGYSEIEVLPNIITLHVTLEERYDGKNKKTIEQIEKDFIRLVKERGIDEKYIKIKNAFGHLLRYKRKRQDVLSTKTYIVEVHNTKELEKVMEVTDLLDIKSIRIQKFDHTDKESLKIQQKAKASKNCKDKADAILREVGQKTGKVIFITDKEGGFSPQVRRYRSASLASMNFDAEVAEKEIAPLDFHKIKFTARLECRFSVE